MKRLFWLLEAVGWVGGVSAVLVAVALLPWGPLGTVFMLLAAAAMISSPIAYQWRSEGTWHARDNAMGWHLMAYMGVLALVMLLAVPSTLMRYGFDAPPAVGLPAFVRPLVWEAVAIVTLWRLIVILRTPRG